MRLPRVVISAVIWLLVIEVLPGPAGWGILAVVLFGTVAGVVAEPAIVRLVWWASRPSTPLCGAGLRGSDAGSRVDRLRGSGMPDAATSSCPRLGSGEPTYPRC